MRTLSALRQLRIRRPAASRSWANAAAAAAAAGCFGAAASCAAAQRSAFDDDELRRALPERARRQQILMEYVASLRPQLQEAMAAAAAGKPQRLEELREEVSAKQEAILFDALPGERRRYMLRHGCAAWTHEALACCAEHSPLIEIGAGSGHWCRALSETPLLPAAAPASAAAAATDVARKVDIVAYDDGSEVPEAVRAMPDMGVRRGGVEVLKDKSHEGRTLLLVYPPPDDMAISCLREYRGSYLIYVGEGRGGYNADSAFFDELQRKWRVKRVLPLRPFSGGYEQLFLLKRRHAWVGEALSSRRRGQVDVSAAADGD